MLGNGAVASLRTVLVQDRVSGAVAQENSRWEEMGGGVDFLIDPVEPKLL